MKVLNNLFKLEIKTLIRSNFYIVILITLMAVIGTWFLLPERMDGVRTIRTTERVSIMLLNSLEQVSLRESFVTVMLSFEVTILGFLFIAVTLFSERDEGIIRAYRVSPGGVYSYTLAKILVWTIISSIYGLIILLLTTRPVFNVITYIPALFILNFFMTTLGFLLALNFKNISDWFFPGISLLVVNMLPQLHFSNPGFNPAWIKIIPGYHIYRIYEGIESHGLTLGIMALISVLLFLITIHHCNRTLMSEDKK